MKNNLPPAARLAPQGEQPILSHGDVAERIESKSPGAPRSPGPSNFVARAFAHAKLQVSAAQVKRRAAEADASPGEPSGPVAKRGRVAGPQVAAGSVPESKASAPVDPVVRALLEAYDPERLQLDLYDTITRKEMDRMSPSKAQFLDVFTRCKHIHSVDLSTDDAAAPVIRTIAAALGDLPPFFDEDGRQVLRVVSLYGSEHEFDPGPGWPSGVLVAFAAYNDSDDIERRLYSVSPRGGLISLGIFEAVMKPPVPARESSG